MSIAVPSASSGLEEFKRVGEFWTAKQRKMHSIHYAVSYRASFKPELPRYFIDRFSSTGDLVLDPFSGRGTTVVQANMMGRRGWSNDVNPISRVIAGAKTNPVPLSDIEARLQGMNFDHSRSAPGYNGFSMFFHRKTYQEILQLQEQIGDGRDDVDRFIQMVALSRLHGHSTGFFSVYTFPQISIPPESQVKINLKYGQKPEYRELAPRILKKAKAILKDPFPKHFRANGRKNLFSQADSRNLLGFEDELVDLTVTSPPFLDKADYIQDNWMEMWFLGVDIDAVRKRVVQTPDLARWSSFIGGTLEELFRVTRPGGVVAMEVGEVRNRGKDINLDELVAMNGSRAGFRLSEVLIHDQDFTKLAHCFNVKNNAKGTNTNRIVVMERPER